MIRSGKVVQTQGDTLKVCFSRLEACDSCNMCGSRDEATVSIKGQAQVGDRVEVEMPDAQVLKVSLLTYVIPLIGLLLGLWLGTMFFSGNDFAVLIAALAGLVAALIQVKLLIKQLGKTAHWQPRLITVLPAEENLEGQVAGPSRD